MRQITQNTSLRQRVVSAGGWTILQFGTAQSIRLASNLILTRLLVPEMFGVMAIVHTVLMAIQMLTDLGIRASIIQDKRGDEAIYLNTAWTIQIIRGVVIWVLLVFVASFLYWIANSGWVNANSAYASPELPWLVAFVGITAVISGFDSVALHLASKKLELKKITLIELVTQLIAITIMIGIATYYRNIWALAIGAVAGAMLKMLASHRYFPENKMQLALDAKVAKYMFHYGKWILVTSVTNFIAQQGDKLLFGYYFAADALGFYIIAAMLANAPVQFLSAVTHKVLFPMFSEKKRNGHESIRDTYFYVQLRIALLLALPAGFLISFAQDIIDFLYDDRYAAAGWMLQYLLIRVLIVLSIGPGVAALLAIGKSVYPAVATVMRATLLISGILVAASWGNENAMVLVVGISALASWPVVAGALVKHDLYNFRTDVAIIGLAFSGFLIGQVLSN